MSSSRPLPARISVRLGRCVAVGFAAAVMLGACTATPEGAPPAAPARRVAAPAWVPAVRRAVRAEDRATAFGLLRSEAPLTVEEPERAWLLVLLAPSWCLSQPVRWAAQALPAGDVGDALRAMTAEDPERAVLRLAAGRGGQERAWRDLATAHLYGRLGDGAQAIAAAHRALASPRDFVRQEAWLVRGRLVLSEGRLEEALAAAGEAGRLDPQDARPPRLAADVHKAAGCLDEAALALLAALQIAPESPLYAHRLAETLREPVAAATWARVDGGLPGLAAGAPGNAELLALRALAAEHAGREDEAIAHYRAALAGGAVAVPLDRDLRRLLMARGRYAEGYALLMRAVPPDVIADPRNRLRPRWEALHAAAERAPSAAAPPAARRELAQALVGVGALEEALSVARDLDDDATRALVRRVSGHLAFEAALRETIEDGYRQASRKEEPPTWEQGLQAMQTLARQHLVPEERAAFARPAEGIRELPLLGAWLDHGADSTSPVVRHFRAYGRFLLFGQRGDVPPEAIVLSLASLTRAQPIRTGGRTYAHDVAIGYDRALRAHIAAQGGVLAGACLADGIWLDADAARRSEHEIRAYLDRDRGYRAVVARTGALTADTLDGPTALTDPGCTAARILARYVARKGEDMWGSFGTLRAHEFGHVIDIDRHLPIWEKLPNTISLLARHGADFDRVQAELEYKAQLVACVEAPDPDLALAEMLVGLPVVGRDPEVHDAGYRDALGTLVRHIATHPADYPQIDIRRRIVTQLDRLTPEQIRRAARAALGLR